ncbi:MAG: aminotransferase class V-fold PLP-dependent enzyme [Gloeomargarita sp. SKYG116]|nr:aminotransferase class V-fold PLP-dependent enzyme [Gloeomargarita sp. SKYG116]MDW8400653.1 aminotransferase class V-fold PLP-dependent enzyme [Gloeomargarita sp. SKYGB_i_bin116]
MDIHTQRQHFPALANKIYLNFGGQGPLPTPALTAMMAAYEQGQIKGPFSRQALTWVEEQEHLTRQAFAQCLQVAVADITLTSSTTQGCAIVLWGWPWRGGEHLLLSDGEHPGVVATVAQLAQRFGLTWSTCPLSDPTVDPITVLEQHVQPHTRMLVLSHVLWHTGQVLPLTDIAAFCQQRDIRLLVDGAQSLGVLPLDLTGVDFYAATGHKWLCGPAGLGVLYIHSQYRDVIQPTHCGWRGLQGFRQQRPCWSDDGQRHEIATTAWELGAGLRASLALHDAWGTPVQRYERLVQLAQDLWQQLGDLPHLTRLLPEPPRCGLVSFRHASIPPETLAQQLEQRNILVRSVAAGNCVRASIHYLTDQDELTQLVRALRELQG